MYIHFFFLYIILPFRTKLNTSYPGRYISFIKNTMGAEIVEYVAGSKGIILSSFACAVVSCISKHSSVLTIFLKENTIIFFFTMWYTYILVSCSGSSDDQSETSTALVVVGSLFLVLGIICLGVAVFLYYNLSKYCIYWINFYWHFNIFLYYNLSEYCIYWINFYWHLNIFCMFCNASITNCRITLVTDLSRMRELRQMYVDTPLMKDTAVSRTCPMEVNVHGGRLVKYRTWTPKIPNKSHFSTVL